MFDIFFMITKLRCDTNQISRTCIHWFELGDVLEISRNVVELPKSEFLYKAFEHDPIVRYC